MFGAEPGAGKQKIKQMKKIRKYITLVKTKVVRERKYNPNTRHGSAMNNVYNHNAQFNQNL